jgi:hypothetical protein
MYPDQAGQMFLVWYITPLYVTLTIKKIVFEKNYRVQTKYRLEQSNRNYTKESQRKFRLQQ